MSTLGQLIGEGVQTVRGTVNGMHRNVLNSIYPREFEAYFISLELTDSNNNIEEYFTFPINPNFISKTEPRTKSIERTFDKVIVNKSDRFTPQDLTLKGNFGRDFKILVRHKGEVVFNSILSKTTMFAEDEFSSTIKSGYGSLKVLQAILDKAESSVNTNPKKLYFHNYLLGESYLVEVIDFNVDQSIQTNMMWNYTIRLKILSPINIGTTSALTRSTSSTVQNTLNNSLSSIRKTLSSLL